MASVIANILSGGALTGISKVIDSIRGKSPEDAEKLQELASKYQSELLAADLSTVKAQTDIDQVEAGSKSIFVAGWRPFIGWVCGTGLLVQFLIRPLFIYFANLIKHPVDFPTLDMGTLMTLLMALLGMGAMRSFDKVNGSASGH